MSRRVWACGAGCRRVLRGCGRVRAGTSRAGHDLAAQGAQRHGGGGDFRDLPSRRRLRPGKVSKTVCGGVAKVAFERGAPRLEPREVDAGCENAERVIVGEWENDERIVRMNTRIDELEDRTLGHSRTLRCSAGALSIAAISSGLIVAELPPPIRDASPAGRRLLRSCLFRFRLCSARQASHALLHTLKWRRVACARQMSSRSEVDHPTRSGGLLDEVSPNHVGKQLHGSRVSLPDHLRRFVRREKKPFVARDICPWKTALWF